MTAEESAAVEASGEGTAETSATSGGIMMGAEEAMGSGRMEAQEAEEAEENSRPRAMGPGMTMGGPGMMRPGMGKGGGMGMMHGMHEKHRQLIGRPDLLDARMPKIEATLERLLEREVLKRRLSVAARVQGSPRLSLPPGARWP